MTIEELSQKIDDLSQKVYELGRSCTDEHFQQDGKHRAILCLAGEFLKNTSFTMDSIFEELTTE
jgi:hypothetical protein